MPTVLSAQALPAPISVVMDQMLYLVTVYLILKLQERDEEKKVHCLPRQLGAVTWTKINKP
jgi:hypothetical protein